MTENIKSKTNKKTSAHYALMNNSTMSVDQVCEVLGISRSTGFSAIKRTGVVIEGVPILRIGDRLLMSAYLLRQILGIEQPTKG